MLRYVIVGLMLTLTLAFWSTKPAQAYEIAFINNISPSEGVGIYFKYHLLRPFRNENEERQANDGKALEGARSWKFKHTGIESGVCFTDIE